MPFCVQEVGRPKIKSRKRILVKEAEEEVQKKFGIQPSGGKKAKAEQGENKPAGAKGKKKLATPKGQRKMTFFLKK